MTDNEKAVIREAFKAEAKRILRDRDCCCGADDGGDGQVDICSAHTVLENLSKALSALTAGTDDAKPCLIQTPHKCHIEEP